MTVDIASLGISVEATSVPQAERSLDRLASTAARVEAQVGKTSQATAGFDRQVRASAAAVESATTQTGALASAHGMLAKAVAAAGAALGAQQLLHLVDEYQKYTSALRLATSSNTEFANSVNAVRSISRQSQTDIAATATLYARIARGTAELGIGQQKVAQLTAVTALALKVSGAAAEEQRSAMLQLSQAFASGTLRGEEFNAVNEAAPRLMQALADGIGVGVGQLRKMAEAGQLTTQVLAEALPKSLGKLEEEAKGVQTIGGAFTVLKNNVMEFVGQSAQASGAVSTISSGISLLANNLELIADAAIGLGIAKLADVLVGLGTTVGANVKKTLEHVAALQAERASAIASAEGQVALASAEGRKLTATQAALAVSRELAISQLQSANAAVIQAEAQIAAARSAGALSASLAVLREGEVALTAATQARNIALAELAALGQQQARVSAQVAAANEAQLASQVALNAATSASGTGASLVARALGLLGGPIGAVTTLLGLGVTAWLAWGSAAKNQETATASVIEKTTAEIIDDLDRQIAKLKERNALAKAGMVDAAKNGGEAGARLAALQKQIDDALKGGGAYTNLPEVARLDIARKLTAQYGELAGRMATVAEEQHKLDAQGQAAKDLAEARAKLFNVDKEYLGILSAYEKALKAGAITEAEYVKELKVLAKEQWNKSEAGKAATKEAEEQKKLLNDYIGVNDDYVESLKRAERVRKASNMPEEEYIKLIKYIIDQQPGVKKVYEEREKAEKAALEIAKERQEQRRKEQEGIDAFFREQEEAQAKAVKSGEEQLAAIQNETAALGMTNVEREKAIALRELERTGIDKSSEKYKQLAKDIQEAIEQREAIKANREMWESIDKTAHDVFVNVLQGGQDAFRKLGATLKAAVLDLLYQMTIKKWIVNVGMNATGGGNAGGIQGIGNAVSSFGSSMGGGFGSLISGVGGSIGTFGSGISAGLSGLVGEAGIAGTFDAGITALGAGNIAGGLGTLIGGALPFIGVGLLVAQALGAFKHGGPKDQSTTGGAAGGQGDPAAATSIANAIQQGYSQAGKALGLVDTTLTNLSVAFAKDPQGTAQTQLQIVGGSYARSDYHGGQVENVGRSDEEFQREVTLATTQLIVKNLQAAVQGKAGDFLRTVNVATASLDELNHALEVATNVGKFEKALQPLGTAFQNLLDLSVENTQALADLAGGFDSLATGLSTYYDKFFSEDEKRAAAQSRLAASFNQLGVQMPATIAGYRQLVESQDLTTEAGRKTYAMLIGNAGAFYELNSSLQDTASGIGDVATATADLSTLVGNLRTAMANLESAKDALRSYGQELESTVTGLEQSINSLRGEALANLQSATAAAQQALANVRAANEAAQAALTTAQQAVKAAQDTITRGYVDALAKQQAVRDQITQAYLAAQAEVNSAQEAYNDLLRQQAERLHAAGDAIRETLKKLAGLDGLGTPAQNRSGAFANFEDLFRKAMAGDAAAAEKISQAGLDAIAASRGSSTSRSAFEADSRYIREKLAIVAEKVGSATAPEQEDPLVAAQERLEAAIIKLKEAQDLAVSTGSSLVASNVDLGQEYRSATQELEKWSAAVAESGASRQVADNAAAAALEAYRDAAKDLTTAQTNANQAAADLATALQAASDAGLEFEDAAKTPLEQFMEALGNMKDAQDAATEVQANLYEESDSLVERYHAQVEALDTARDALAKFQDAVSGIDLSQVDRLAQLVSDYLEANQQVATARSALLDTPQGAEVANAYHDLLNRDPENQGLQYWVGKIAAGMTDEQLRQGIKASPEYAQLATQQITSLYNELLKRTPEQAGLSFYLDQLQNQGYTIDQVRQEIENSPEYLSMPHAMGLERVPYDGYRAKLHRDEMVLTSSEANAHRRRRDCGDAVDVLERVHQTLSTQTNDVRRVYAELVFRMQNVDQTLRKFDNDGMPETRT